MSGKRFDNVWDAIENDPRQAEDLKLRASLMVALREKIRKQQWTQAEAAKRFNVTQPRISALVTGKIDQFSVGTLITMALKSGLHVEMTIREAA